MRFEKGNKIGHRFTSDNQPPAYKKKPKLRAIPPDAREKVFAALYYALTLPDKAAADAALQKVAQDLPECGYLIQVYARGLMGRNGADVADKILDRLFGKAKQVSEIGFTKEVPVLMTEDEAKALGKWAKGEDGEK